MNNRNILIKIKEAWGCECLIPVGENHLAGGNFDFSFNFGSDEVYLNNIRCRFLAKEYDIGRAFGKIHPPIVKDGKVITMLKDLDLDIAHKGVRRCCAGGTKKEDQDFTRIPDEYILDQLGINMINIYTNHNLGNYFELFCRTKNCFEEKIKKFRISDVDDYYTDIKKIIDGWYSVEKNNNILNKNMMRIQKFTPEQLISKTGEELQKLYECWNYSLNEYINNIRRKMNIDKWMYEINGEKIMAYAPKREFDLFLSDPVISKLVEYSNTDFGHALHGGEAEYIVRHWKEDRYNPNPFSNLKSIKLLTGCYLLDSEKLDFIWFTIFGTLEPVGKCIHIENL